MIPSKDTKRRFIPGPFGINILETIQDVKNSEQAILDKISFWGKVPNTDESPKIGQEDRIVTLTNTVNDLKTTVESQADTLEQINQNAIYTLQ